MHFLQPQLHSRRAFLKRSGQLALAGTALPLALNLAAMGEAAAFNATNSSNATDYKALVCVFMYGGNDSANTVVPFDIANYDLYSAIRGGGPGRTAGGIALGQAALGSTVLNPTVPATNYPGYTGGARQFALNPAMGTLANLFNTNKAAVVLNTGPLLIPLTRDQYNSANYALYPRPPRLFSHNDQQSVWQSSSPEGSKVGWGGNIGDLALSANTTAGSIFTCMSVTGNAVFLSGDTALQYQVSKTGAIPVNSAVNAAAPFGSSNVGLALNSLIQQPRAHVLENEYNKVTARSMSSYSAVSNALTQSDPALPFANANAAFPSGNALADQLKMVARLIKGRSSLGVQRQVFLVSIGGFDTHDYLARDHGGFMDASNNMIPGLMGQVNDAMSAFYYATVEMGLADKVTTFTASDFGRTLTSNGDGSDHGWGGHHFVVGDAVKGKAFYGTAPPISASDAKTGNAYNPENQWHVGKGRLLPTTSVDQYGATLAQWFGVAQSEMVSVLPNIGNFPGSYAGGYLGFMTPS